MIYDDFPWLLNCHTILMAPEWLNLVHFFPRDFDFLINLTTKPCSKKGQKNGQSLCGQGQRWNYWDTSRDSNRLVLNMISVLARISCPGALGYSNVTTSAARNQWKISAGTRIVTNCTTGNNPGSSYLHLGFRTKCGIFVGEVYAGSKLLKSQFDCIGPGLPILVDGWSTLFSWKSHP